MRSWLFDICVFVSEKVRKQKRKQTISPSRSDDIRAAVCVWPWAYDKLSENNAVNICACVFLAVSDVMNTLPSLTSRSQQDTHVHRC